MQQTPNYKFNLIETSDTFSPAPLNENAEKTETALDSLAAVDSALGSRIATLELHCFSAGSYKGNGASAGQLVDVGFAPKVVFASSNQGYSNFVMATYNISHVGDTGLKVEGNGFRISGYMNSNYSSYCYLAMS